MYKIAYNCYSIIFAALTRVFANSLNKLCKLMKIFKHVDLSRSLPRGQWVT